MKVLGIVGSPRKEGNTSQLVRQALDGMMGQGVETEMIHLADYDFCDCRGCEGCSETYACVIGDGMQKVYPQLLEADAVVLGSPTYFYDVTALMKAFLDRLYCFEAFDDEDRSVWMGVNEALGGKLAVVISVCEQSKAEDAGFAAKTMAMTMEALGYRVVDTVQIAGLFAKDEAGADREAQARARAAGRRLARTMLLKQRIREKLTTQV